MMNFQSPQSLGRISVLQYYVVILLALLAFTGLLDLFIDEETRTINLHHMAAALGLIVFFRYGRIVLPPMTIGVFFIVMVAASILAGISHGINPMLMNVAYEFYLCLLGLLCAQTLTRAQLQGALRGSAWVILAGITIKNFFYIHDILDTMSTLSSRVYIPTIMSGGVNIEATFALFAAVFLRGTRAYWPVFAYAVILAIVYSSRTVILGDVFLFIYEVFQKSENRTVLYKQARAAGLIFGALALAAAIFSSPIAQYAMSRFEDIGYEAGSESRLTLWEAAPEVFTHNPFGVGAGNAVLEIGKVLGHDVQEDSVHNVYLQVLLDGGLFGFVAYLVLVYSIFRRAIADKTHNPLWIAIGLYFLMGFSQFRVYDAFFYFWLGLAWHENQKEVVAV